MRLLITFILVLICFAAQAQIGMQLGRTVVSGGGGINDPSDIPDLFIWIDAQDIDGDGIEEGLSESTLSGSTIVDVIDKSSNGWNLSAFGSPVLQDNGAYYSIACDGNDYMKADEAASNFASLHTGDVTVFCRFEVNNYTETYAHYLFSTNNSSQGIGHHCYYGDFSWVEGFNVITANGTSSRNIFIHLDRAGIISASNTFYVWAYSTDIDASPQNDRFPWNDLEGTELTINNQGSTGIASSSDPDDSFRFMTGGTATHRFKGSITDMIIYNRQLTSQERDDVILWIENRY